MVRPCTCFRCLLLRSETNQYTPEGVKNLKELTKMSSPNSQNIQDTLNERQKIHGDFLDNARVMQALKEVCRVKGVNWNVGELMDCQKEAIEMICHKLGRILSGNPNEPDHWKDIAGYATLVENILTTGRSHINEEAMK